MKNSAIKSIFLTLFIIGNVIADEYDEIFLLIQYEISINSVYDKKETILSNILTTQKYKELSDSSKKLEHKNSHAKIFDQRLAKQTQHKTKNVENNLYLISSK
ncbi:MAG: hypothetical protein LBJ88_00715 [Campylobacteraceae bacterium]|jgi:hypothetical protein|nr:hypothetical protein [Campylobacteraceae bacterium]